MRVTILIMLAMLTGCTSSPGVISVGSNTYSVMISGQSGFVPVGGMKADAYVEAKKHCEKQNKLLEEVDFNSTSGFGKFPEVELKFKCVGKIQ